MGCVGGDVHRNTSAIGLLWFIASLSAWWRHVRCFVNGSKRLTPALLCASIILLLAKHNMDSIGVATISERRLN